MVGVVEDKKNAKNDKYMRKTKMLEYNGRQK